jgi:chromosomal replication initiator protein
MNKAIIINETNREVNEAAWVELSDKFIKIIGEGNFNSWIKPLKFSSYSSAILNLKSPTRFIRDWVNSNYSEIIRNIFRDSFGNVAAINIVVDSQIAIAPASTDSQSSNQDVINFKPSAGNRDFSEIESILDPRFKFENFVVGNSNSFAYAAAKSVAESNEVIAGSNPLFIYGGVGLGKTHLMHAIAWKVKEQNPDRKILYLSAEKFMYKFIKSLQDKNIVSFKEYFRSVDVLLIDDIQFICGKNSTQEEFFHTFNALIENGKQLVLSADRSPSDMGEMEERIKSRLGWGLVADINSTSFELRLGILETKVKSFNLNVPKDVLEFLAENITSNIRELEGALNKIVAQSRLLREEISLDYAKRILKDLLKANQKNITIDQIKKLVSEQCAVKLGDINSPKRTQNIARARQLAMYFAKKYTNKSLPEIGKNFGGKDHTTVLHAVRKIEELKDTIPEIRENLEVITRLLEK